jgi:L-lactate dehydrogenase (cytochrome)
LHPGGADIILNYAGKDATKEFESLHAAGTLERSLLPENFLGELALEDRVLPANYPDEEELRISRERKGMPHLDQIRSLADLEVCLESQ